MIKFQVVIPARYASTRLPGKPLLDIAGKPMVIWVIERALQSGAAQVIVATDHKAIFDVVKDHGYQAIMTKETHLSGTDRIAEVVSRLGFADDDIIVNVQGDEPMIAPALIYNVADSLSKSAHAVMSTACHAITSDAEMQNPNVVKVIFDKDHHALYFSRAPIPFLRDDSGKSSKTNSPMAYRHIGLYGYRTHFLKHYTNLPPAEIECIESLEQLRVLFEGYKIAVSISEAAPASGVDCIADLEHIRQVMTSQ